MVFIDPKVLLLIPQPLRNHSTGTSEAERGGVNDREEACRLHVDEPLMHFHQADGAVWCPVKPESQFLG